MSGIGILFCILIYMVLALLIISKAKTMHVKIIVLILAVLLPTADAVYGRYKLKQMCAAEAGLKVYRVVESVKGFMARTATEDLLKKYGYQFMEGGYPNHFYRFSLIDSEVLIEENVVPRSQYEFKFIKTRNKGYIKKSYIVQDMQGNKLGEQIEIGFNGGWAERFLGQFAGGGPVTTWCTPPPWLNDRKKEVILNTLKP